MKKLLSALLACALGLALLVPAGAMPNPDYLPTFTQQPPKSLSVAAGKEFTLEIKAEPPKVGGTMTYQWYRASVSDLLYIGGYSEEPIAGATQPKLTLTAEIKLGGESLANAVLERYFCRVTTAFGNGESSQWSSDYALVCTYFDLAGAADYLSSQWNLGLLPFLRGLADVTAIPVIRACLWLGEQAAALRG